MILFGGNGNGDSTVSRTKQTRDPMFDFSGGNGSFESDRENKGLFGGFFKNLFSGNQNDNPSGEFNSSCEERCKQMCAGQGGMGFNQFGGSNFANTSSQQNGVLMGGSNTVDSAASDLTTNVDSYGADSYGDLA